MPPAKRDRTTGLPLPSPVVPETSICFTIQVPNALEYRSALKGFLSELGKAWTWSQTAGEDNQDAYTAAELWRERIAAASYDLDCEGDMSCEDIADCIDTNEAVQEAITNVISQGSGQQTIYETTVVGAPMTPAQRNTTVGKALDGCDPDSLFGSITSIVDTINQNNVDFLELILLSDNNQQRISKVIKAIPLLNEVPIDEAMDFVSQLTVEIKENYDAEYTTAVRDTYRCDLFCLVKDADPCELTFQMIVEYFNNRLGTALEPINFFGAVVTYFIAGTWSGTTVVDIMSLIQMSAWQQASDWTGISLRSLETVGLLGANDPDPDWELICEDCAPEPPDDHCDDLIADQGLWYSPSGNGIYHAGQGFGPFDSGGTPTFSVQRANGEPVVSITSVTFTSNVALGDFYFFNHVGYSLIHAGSNTTFTVDATTSPGYFPFAHGIGANQFGITFASNIAPSFEFRLAEVCFEIEE